MAKWLYIVESNTTDPAREAEFNEWYDKTHLPDILETAGFIKATRYEDVEPAEGKGKFIALYEMEADDINEALKALGENVERKRAEGRMSDLITAVSRRAFKQISSLTK